MPDVPGESDLVQHVIQSAGLTPGEAQRVIDDVIAFYAEPTEDFVRRRHEALKLRGMRNDEIFDQISAELGHRVVKAPLLTSRQLRRMIYG